MNAKWYISTLFLLFSLFGTIQEQVTTPNQEIVLEFFDVTINNKNIESTIADVKEKLLDVGVSNIVINKTKNGTLKISYYSTIPIDNVRKALEKEQKFILNQGSEKKDKNNTLEYNIDIYELTNEADTSNTSDDKFVLEIKFQSDRFITYNSLAFLKLVDSAKETLLFSTNYNKYKNFPFVKDKSSYKEPEVRAGPLKFIS
ncbi:hypothetical protein [Polaribacter aquimarinus]|uniref:Uncharacterized protein n=1 Tax=Polaribacter aquimarinus TaxID=2100726 RepID=A0A2U2JE72_9FLAO|nr:hypothetical protein [Polaribacter aquimarinus]PWG06605.1 hypothetical protein DIS07_01855 [Polaribacter aquimarinus]